MYDGRYLSHPTSLFLASIHNGSTGQLAVFQVDRMSNARTPAPNNGKRAKKNGTGAYGNVW